MTLAPNPEEPNEASHDWSDVLGPMKRRSEEEEMSQQHLQVNIPPKQQGKGDWRLLFGNINGFPINNNNENSMKLDIWRHLLQQSDADIIGIGEHKLNMSKLQRRDKPSHIMNNWKEGILGRYSWLRSNSPSKYELGGTGLISSSIGTTHTIDAGEDKRHLGRWNWITIQGQRGNKTTIISLYRPAEGQQTLQRQYARLCEKQAIKGDDTTLSIWDNDLRTLIESFTSKEHEVIVGGDWNNDLNNTNGRVHTMLKEVGLREVIIERYGSGPNTHARGSNTIDGVFATAGITIKRGGYTTFECSPSDHRWVWLDISTEDMVGAPRDDRPPPMERRATTKIPSVKRAFQRLLSQQVEVHQLQTKMATLFEEVQRKPTMSQEQSETYEQIEERMQRAIKFADSRCRKVRRGALPFSPLVTKLIGEIRVLKMILHRHVSQGQLHRPRMRKVKRLAHKYNYSGPLTFSSKDDIITSLKSAQLAYKQFQPRASEARYQYLQQLADEFAEGNNKGAEWHFNRLIQHEKSKELFKRIKKAEGKGFRRGVDRVDIPTSEGLQTLLDRESIDQAIRDANVSKRLQANHTPLRMEPLRTLVGERMDYAKWESILKKEVSLQDLEVEEGTRLWFDFIQCYEDKPEPITWTTEEYCESWAKMPENKSCLPGIHTVHIKCLDPSSPAAEVMSRLALIPLLTGYAPQRWKKGIDSMIPKKTKGELRPDKLRLILLMDARFNHNNKLIGRKIMQYGEKHGLLAPEQFGSRKNKSAIEHAVNKRLTLDVARQYKAECIYIANDAKSCYDRILMLLIYLTMRNFGISEAAAMSSVETLATMQMKIKTVYGVSKVAYGGDEWEDCPHGCGQGNGYGPAIWAAISSPLLKIMKEKGFGTNISSPITKEQLHMAAFSFVDDTDQIELNLEHHPWNKLLQRAQASLTLWESLLRTTGGAIEPTKSDWTRLSYKWNKGRAVLKTNLSPDQLTVRDSNGNLQILRQTPSNSSRETLGVWQAVNGDDTVQAEKLINKIQDWGNNIKRSDMSRSETRTSVNITIGKSIRYPLAATAITPTAAYKVDSAFRKAALGKMGIVRTAPVLPTGAPLELGGLGMNNTVTVNQMIDHLAICMQHGHTSSATGHLLRTSYECLAIEAGVLGDPTALQLHDIPWVTDNTWVGNTSESLAAHGLQLQSGMKGLSTWTNTDCNTLMEMASPLLDHTNHHSFNKVRMHLRVITASDMFTADGRSIDLNIYKGLTSTSPTPSSHAYIWPRVPKPTKTEVKTWQTILGRLFNITSTHLRLSSTAIMHWDSATMPLTQWNYDKASDLVYEKTTRHWKQWKLQTNSRRRSGTTYIPHGTVHSLPRTACPATVHTLSPCRIQLECVGTYANLEGDDPATSTGWVLRNLTSSPECEATFLDKIESHQGHVVSDGSYKNGRSSSAFRVVHTDILGSNTVPGNKTDQSSYRGELAGILAGIMYTNRICRRKGVTSGTCTYHCDNKGALQAAFGWKQPNPRWSCYDIVCLIRYHLHNSPIHWTWKHIYGHQDDHTAYDDLTPAAQANVDADHAADTELKLNITPSPEPLQGQSWRLFDLETETYISGNLDKAVRTKAFEQPMKEYWQHKFGLDSSHITSDTWALFKKHCRRQPPHLAIWHSKYNQRILGVKKNLHRRRHSDNDKCPLCSQTEDTDHVFQCSSSQAEEAYQDNIQHLQNLLTLTTSSDIGDALLEVCNCLRYNRRPILQDHWDPLLTTTVQQQLQTGLRAFLGGIWVPQWIALQTRFCATTNSQKCPTIWACKAITGVQTLLRAMWSSRNHHMHNTETSEERLRIRHQLGVNIDILFTKKKQISNQFLRRESAAFFRQTAQQIKKRPIKRQQRWVEDAQIILDHATSVTPQQMRFRKYFQFRDSG